MKSFLLSISLVFIASITVFSQNNKFRFMIDGNQFIDIRQNEAGFNYIHQSNLQTSMFFGFNSGLNTIDDPSVFSSGDNNSAYGFNTLASNTTGFRNTAIGSGAMDENTTGSVNTAIGFSALGDCVDCNENVGIGKSALLKNESGFFNVAVGNDALNNTNTAQRTTAIGFTAGVNDSSSVDNVYVGYGTGRGTVLFSDGFDRKENVMLGSYAGFNNKTNGNIFLGYQAGYNSEADNQLYITNSDTDSLNTLIYGQFDNEFLRINGELNIDGLYTMPTTAPDNGEVLRATGGSGDLYWYDLDVTWESGVGDDVVYEDGDVGVGIGNPIYKLDVAESGSTAYIARFRNTSSGTSSRGVIIQTGPNVNPTSSVYYALCLDGNGTNIGGIRGNGTGGVMYSTTSDRRLKQNIKTFNKGLATLEKINPTIYQMKSNPSKNEIGFIAQELYEVLPQVVGGQPTDDVDESPMTVDYGKITPVLAAAIKEQQVIIDELQTRLEARDKEFNELKAMVYKMQGVVKK